MIVPMTKEEIIDNLKQKTIDNLSIELERRFSHLKHDIMMGRPFQVAKESWEYAFADATEWIGGEWVGSGKNPEDVHISNNKYDIKGLSSRGWKNWSTEASVRQTVKNEYNIDESFIKKDSLSLWESVVHPWIEKVYQSNYHITIFWRNKENNDLRLIMLKVVKENNIEYDKDNFEFSKTQSLMRVKNLCEPNQIKLYVLKCKKRMEMRISGKFFDNPKYHLNIMKNVFANESTLEECFR